MVLPPGSVVLTAPPNIPVERLDEVVQAKARWITSRLRLVRPLEPRATPREFISGESFLYLGRQYRLEVRRNGNDVEVHLERGKFRVSLPSSITASVRSSVVKAALVSWYRRHAQARLTERVVWWARRLGVALPQVLVREQEKRWGSCAPGVVRFNWRIVQAPMKLFDYVVAHEITHLLHDDHGKAFWAQLGRVLPDYETRRAELHQLGALLIW
ncbi:M48 family metallopeptidase [Corallococcus exiguus]|uniref:M48 family metallopeptidase n=1 Tax=Corallococcus exiguus TaxID=83462 RepID=UPI0039775C9C